MSGSNAPHKLAGVLGGMGPDATVDFMHKVITMTGAGRDQDHVRMLVDHNPAVPGRQNPTPGDDALIRATLADMALGLQAAGADFLVMVCNTAHAFDDEARRAVRIPFLSIVDVTVQAIRKRYPAVRRAGLMATPALIDAGLYQRALSAAGLATIAVEGRARDALMELIRRVKAGEQGSDVADGMAAVARGLVSGGAELVIAGCTEIPLVLHDAALAVPLISSTDELARQTIEIARGNAAPPPAATND